jgi:hypothetical protein
VSFRTKNKIFLTIRTNICPSRQIFANVCFKPLPMNTHSPNYIWFFFSINHDNKNLFYLNIGITTGMFGSAMEITLPKLIDMLFIFLGILTSMLALCWRKCRLYQVSFRAFINQTRRRFENRSSQIERENSVPIQILVSSRTNLVNDHENLD